MFELERNYENIHVTVGWPNFKWPFLRREASKKIKQASEYASDCHGNH